MPAASTAPAMTYALSPDSGNVSLLAFFLDLEVVVVVVVVWPGAGLAASATVKVVSAVPVVETTLSLCSPTPSVFKKLVLSVTIVEPSVST